MGRLDVCLPMMYVAFAFELVWLKHNPHAKHMLEFRVSGLQIIHDSVSIQGCECTVIAFVVPFRAMDFYAAWDFAEKAFVEPNPAEPDDATNPDGFTDLDFLLQQAASMNIYPSRSQAWFFLS